MNEILQYFSFLRTDFLNVLVKEYQQTTKNVDFSLLQFLFQDDGDNAFLKINEYFDTILSWLETDVFIEKQKALIGKINSETFSKNQTGLLTIHSFFFHQKELLLKYLLDYTKEARVILDIVSFLEKNYHQIEDELTEVYSLIKENETKKIIESCERFKLIMQEATDLIFIYSFDRQILYIAPCIEDILGFKQEEVMGRNVEEIVHPEDLSIFETSEPVKKTFRLQKKNGGFLWIESKPCSFKDSKGDVKEIHWIVSDISHQIENGKKLYQLAAIVESTRDAIFSRSGEGIIMSWNPGAEKLLGYGRGEIIGMSYSILIPPVLDNELTQIVERVNKGESIQDIETILLKKDRAPIDVSLTISPIMNTHGNIIGESFVVRDITEKIQLEKELLESEQKYSQIVEDAVDAIYTCDFQGNFTYVNPAFKKMTGYEPEEVIGNNFTDLIDPEWKEKVKLFYKEQFTKRISQTVFSFPYLNSRGEEKWIEQTVNLQEEDEWVVGFQSVVRDISDRKMAEERIKHSEEKLRKFMDNIPLGIFILDENGKTYYVNNKAIELIGRGIAPDATPEELFSTYHVYVSGTDNLYPVDLNPLTRALKTGESSTKDDIEIRQPGKTIQIEGAAAPIFDEQGKIEFAIATFGDISDRKKAEEALKGSEERLRQFLEAIPIGAFVIGKDGTTYFANQQASEILGREILHNARPEELSSIYQAYRFGTDQPYPTDQLPIIRALRSGERSYADDLEIRRPDKNIRIQIWGAPIFDEKGNVEYAIAVFEDVTERIMAEEKIKQSEEKIRKFMEALPFAIFIIDKHGRSYYANKKSVELLGKGVMENASLEQLTQVYKVYKAGSNELYPFDQFPINKALAGESTYVDDMEISQNNKRIPIQVYGDPVFDEQGNVAYAIAAFEDISHRKKMEQWHAEMILDLGKKNKELNNFAFVVSHDLKAPLRAIASLSNWIYNDYHDKLNEDGKSNLNLLVEKVNLLDKLIDGILHYSRIGRMTESKAEVNMEELIREQIELLSPFSNINIQIETPMPVIYMDKTLIAQVFQNLISNAIKFMDKPEGKIKIGCTDQADNYTFYVADNGPGIEEKYQEKIFKLFQSLSSQATEPAGVGLTIVKKIIESKNGKIWVQSKPGEGSAFFFILPKEEVKAPIGKILQEA